MQANGVCYANNCRTTANHLVAVVRLTKQMVAYRQPEISATADKADNFYLVAVGNFCTVVV